MELIRSKMLIDGYKAVENFSHEAGVSYLLLLKFSENTVSFVNELRYSRNSVVYYGGLLSVEYAKKVFEFTKNIYLELKEFVENA